MTDGAWREHPAEKRAFLFGRRRATNRVVVDLERPAATLLSNGRPALRAAVGVGMPSSPEPAEPTHAHSGEHVELASAAEAVEWERCVILWESGSRRSRFRARGIGHAGRVFVVAESRAFGPRRADEAMGAETVLAAHRELVDGLLAEGWEAVGRGEAWYEQIFRRRPPAPAPS
jgi:hypothetical protein